MKIGKFIGEKMFKPKLVEHIPGKKRVYQNIFGKTTFRLEEETMSAGDIIRQANQSPAYSHWVNLDANFPLHKLPQDTLVTQERFWAYKDRSFIDKIRCFFSKPKVSKIPESGSVSAPINCDTKIEGKMVHNMHEMGGFGSFGDTKRNITIPNMQALLDTIR